MGMITAMYALSNNLKAPRSVVGAKIPHPCGQPGVPPEQDLRLRREIVLTALKALETDVAGPMVFRPDVTFVVS